MASARITGGSPYCIDDEYYYFDKDGVMKTGWIFNGFAWLYANESGVLYDEKWLFSGGNWYYFNNGCYMLSNVTAYSINGIDYDFDEDGVCLNPYATVKLHESGWAHEQGYGPLGDKWYYFDADGYMACSEYRDGYWLGADGAWVEEYSGGHWMQDSTGWWYTDNSGWYPASQWLKIDGSWYYFDATGYFAN